LGVVQKTIRWIMTKKDYRKLAEMFVRLYTSPLKVNTVGGAINLVECELVEILRNENPKFDIGVWHDYIAKGIRQSTGGNNNAA
jgi:hypothetical protein